MKTFIIIFGISGDLAKRKLLPALTRLKAAGRLSEDSVIIGTARRELDRDELLSQAGAQALAQQFWLRQVDSGDTEQLRGLSEEIVSASSGQPSTKLMYASVPPAATAGVVAAVGASGLAAPSGGPVRLLLEKPFGYDLESSRQLNLSLHQVLADEQVFRIDHYLEKSAIRRLVTGDGGDPLMGMDFAGGIGRIEIEALEELAVEGRGDFYDATGALRDIIQSHLVNLAAAVMVGIAGTGPADGAARLAALRSLGTPLVVSRQARRGQYEGYGDDIGKPTSTTETFAELTLASSDEAFKGLPIVLRTGKAMAGKRTEIRIYKRDDPTGAAAGCTITLAADGYEQVLDDAINGRRQGFLSAAEVEEAWRIVAPVLEVWSGNGQGLVVYERGSSGV